jgi:hypothetical protein
MSTPPNGEPQNGKPAPLRTQAFESSPSSPAALSPPALGLVGDVEAAPPLVDELADACVRFVQAALGVRLDFSAETLPLLDHYIAARRSELVSRPETVGLIGRAAGAYFGEVVRRRFRSFWHLESDDPSTWEIRFEPVYLAFSPLAVAYDAITHGDEEGPTAHIQLDDEDREALEARLAELPTASDDEFFSFSTRLEVLDIAVDAIKARMMSSGLGEVAFTSEDYREG